MDNACLESCILRVVATNEVIIGVIRLYIIFKLTVSIVCMYIEIKHCVTLRRLKTDLLIIKCNQVEINNRTNA